ncbi:hypothetical protein ABTM93_19425, partial [Acinetobacter baumannii]
MERLGQGHRSLRYVVTANSESEVQQSEPLAPRRQREGNAAMSMSLFQNAQSALSPDYIFETFIVGDSNRLTHAAALAVGD